MFYYIFNQKKKRKLEFVLKYYNSIKLGLDFMLRLIYFIISICRLDLSLNISLNIYYLTH